MLGCEYGIIYSYGRNFDRTVKKRLAIFLSLRDVSNQIFPGGE
jgi:hypothetical protein